MDIDTESPSEVCFGIGGLIVTLAVMGVSIPVLTRGLSALLLLPTPISGQVVLATLQESLATWRVSVAVLLSSLAFVVGVSVVGIGLVLQELGGNV